MIQTELIRFPALLRSRVKQFIERYKSTLELDKLMELNELPRSELILPGLEDLDRSSNNTIRSLLISLAIAERLPVPTVS
jgi:hypothetical protein